VSIIFFIFAVKIFEHMKLNDDKYYTPSHVVDRCLGILTACVDMGAVTEVVEPSCGDGAFMHSDNVRVDIGIDIRPETDDPRVIEADYLSYEMPYKKGRLTLGNPPYGSRMNLAQKFFKKAVSCGDYVAMILPISQLWNTQSLYEFDLIESIDLGEETYSGRKLHCCFNVYRRPEGGGTNERPKTNLKRVNFVRNDSNGYDDAPFDVRVCLWGDGSCGKILSDGERYSAEYKIKVDDNLRGREKVVDFIRTHDWRSEVRCIAMKKLQKFHFVNAIVREFPWID